MNKDFRSDNTLGCSPEIIDALSRASTGSVSSYGNDEITARLRDRLRDIFETDLEIFPVLTGTAGNALSLAVLTPPWGAVFCHEDAHIQRDELGAPEFYTLGAKLIPIKGADGKLHAPDVEEMIHDVGDSGRQAIPSALSITQVTEAGTVYSVDEMNALGEVARRAKIGIHVDGARFGNAVAATGASPADLTWRAGVDLLVFGGTKNGAMAAEAVVVFRRELKQELALRFHRGAHRLSKMRFLSAQLEAYVTNDLWLRNARQANAAAARIRDGITRIAGIEVVRPVDANIVFARIPKSLYRKVQNAGFLFYEWPIFGADVYRIVTGFSTTIEDADGLINALK